MFLTHPYYQSHVNILLLKVNLFEHWHFAVFLFEHWHFAVYLFEH